MTYLSHNYELKSQTHDTVIADIKKSIIMIKKKYGIKNHMTKTPKIRTKKSYI